MADLGSSKAKAQKEFTEDQLHEAMLRLQRIQWFLSVHADRTLWLFSDHISISAPEPGDLLLSGK